MNSFWNFLKKNKLYAAINLAGLAISMAFVLLLATYVQRQLTTDAFQEDADRIFLVGNENNINSAYWLNRHLKNNFPEIEYGCAISSGGYQEFTHDGKSIVAENSLFADSSFFDIFSYQIVAGSKDAWHGTTDQCMVSEKFANTHFADKDPIGIVLGNENTQFTICGVYKDFGNSILETPDLLLHGELLTAHNDYHGERMSNAGAVKTFLKAHKGVDLQAKHDEILKWCEENYWIYKAEYNVLRLIPLRDVYFLQSGINNSQGDILLGNWGLVMLLLAMCILLLAFAVLNYINMTTALTGFRAKEMATRRLVGADIRNIFLKIIAESTIICFISMVLAVVLAEALAPKASQILDYKVGIFDAITPASVVIVLGFIALLGIIAGIVPALIILKVHPIEIVLGTLRHKTKTTYSRIIIVVQNVVAICMIVGAITMNLQINHLISADLGYNTKDIMVLSNHFAHYPKLQPLLDRLRSEPYVESIGLSSGLPLFSHNHNLQKITEDKWFTFDEIRGDDNLFEILGLQVKQDNNAESGIWLNEQAFKDLGIDESCTQFSVPQAENLPIAGVYYDFKTNKIIDNQSSALIYHSKFSEERTPWQIVLKTTGDKIAALKQTEAICKELFPNSEFDAQYYEDRIKEDFIDESRVLKIVSIFTLLSILVAALGLFAMSAYYMRQEIRTVSVKKVFGAEVSGVLNELVLAFMKMVGIAFVIAVPVAYYIMKSWLSNYSHRINLHWWIFALAGLTVAAIAAISVLYQSIRTARTNPALALKKE